MPSVNWSATENSLNAFISYAAEDQAPSSDLATALDQYYVHCFLAPRAISPSEDWERNLRNALMYSDVGIAVISTRFNASPWTNQEVGYLLGRNRPVFSVQIGGAPPGFLGRLQGIDALGRPTDEVARDLARLLARDGSTATRYMDVIERRIRAASSLREAALAISQARLIQNWPATQADRIRQYVAEESDFWRNSFKQGSLLEALQSPDSGIPVR